MKQTIKGVVIGAVVATGVSILLAQPTWTTPRTWATDDLLTAGEFNTQFRDNLEWLRQDATLTGTDALDDLGCGTRGSGEVLYSDCDWAALPAGVVFDIHDDVGTAATIVDSDRIPFSDESVNGDPMRFTTAANLANYMQGEVELSADRVTSDTFSTARIPNLSADKTTSGTFSVDRIPNLPASKLPAPPEVTIAALGCNGTPSAATFLRGDCEWAELPTTTVVALDMGSTSTTSSQFVRLGPSATLPVTGTHTVGLYFAGTVGRTTGGTGCEWRIINVTTGTIVITSTVFFEDVFFPNTDSSPSTTTDNVYELQMRRTVGTCAWSNDGIRRWRGFIGVLL